MIVMLELASEWIAQVSNSEPFTSEEFCILDANLEINREDPNLTISSTFIEKPGGVTREHVID